MALVDMSRSSAGVSPALRDRYRRVRADTLALTAPLSAEDQTIQSMPDTSPSKWHLAHTTWFFEEFVLAGGLPGYQRFDAEFSYLFNSYYNAVGPMHARPQRGLLSRPALTAVHRYREHVDAAMEQLFEVSSDDPAATALILLGTHHEQQHQELILTDIKHALACNPLLPVYTEGEAPASNARAMRFTEGVEGPVEIGHQGSGFHYDNEGPRHTVWLHRHALADRLVTNGEFRAFIDDGGYRTPALWLSEGWSTVQEQGWQRPYYWSEDLEREFTLHGEQAIDPHRPVCHLSYFEADAFARWAGARLPTEAEWESAASGETCPESLWQRGWLHPAPVRDTGNRQFHGQVWEWTASAYSAYPGYRPAAGAVGEYNGKFMCNQYVLRGGSCATPPAHLRTSYRNFFPTSARWQFSGLRLARDN
ncbi:ergothioneine biosynthesis protein EgtB [Methylonatrum kenyense]|uniref:ergothioneine biosynthesis protein EgtB n=1 Tax=Methylonatrum kenyense TaxID=455253 RepID=UPI0020C138ED|nr:ergothioneine biosynthesis protein EgtB [Methylonatrum kenyense]MCK8516694.1 ergothioneine biosynthesis protein EgtB [Methylonatrum kenyense]